jgi:membrane-associated phospholipid phosphatase
MFSAVLAELSEAWGPARMGDLMEAVTRASNAAYEALNSLSGRSWTFDMLVALPLDNPLVKAGPLGACFAYAWYAGGDQTAKQRRRRVLIGTLLSLCAVLVVTKTLSADVFLPRPFILSQKVYVIDDGQLAPAERLDYRPPLAGESRVRYESLLRGDAIENDLGSFPSDHAGFYTALALGIFLACRIAGLLAIGWTVVMIMLSRIVTGMHSPLDIVAGATLGVASLVAVQWAMARPARRVARWAVDLTFRYEGLASALLFLTLFEAVSTLANVRELAGSARDVASGLLGHWS